MTRSYWQYLAIFYRIAAQTNQNEGLFAPETLKDSILIFNHSQISQDGESRRRIYRAFRASLPSNYLTMQPSNHANHQPIQLPNHPTYLTMEQSNYPLSDYTTRQSSKCPLSNYTIIHYPLSKYTILQVSNLHPGNLPPPPFPQLAAQKLYSKCQSVRTERTLYFEKYFKLPILYLEIENV